MYLSDRRYDQIKKVIVSLYEKLTINTLPIDCEAITAKLGIKLIPYSSLSLPLQTKCLGQSKDGFTLGVPLEYGEYKYRIYYNDHKIPARIRFTIMHEIGHIILGHQEESDLAESEANFFAKYALAPPPLVHQIDPSYYIDIAEAFMVSPQCAVFVMNYYMKWLHCSPEYTVLEIHMLELFNMAC